MESRRLAVAIDRRWRAYAPAEATARDRARKSRQVQQARDPRSATIAAGIVIEAPSVAASISENIRMLHELRQAVHEKLALVQETRPVLLRQLELQGSADPECRRALEENATAINEAGDVLPRIQAMIARLEHVQRVGYVSNDGFSAPHRMGLSDAAARQLPPLRR